MRLAFVIAAYLVPMIAILYWAWLWTLVSSITDRQRYLAGALALIPFAAGVFVLYQALTFPDEGLIVEMVAIAFIAVVVGPPLILVGVSGAVIALLPVNRWRARIASSALLMWLAIPVLAVMVYAAWLFVRDPVGMFWEALRRAYG